MDIRHETKGKKGTFFIDESGKRTAEIEYFHSADGEITVYHTEVDEKFRGQGVGKRLVERAVEFAREQDLKIIARCPFAHKVIENDDKLQSVLA